MCWREKLKEKHQCFQEISHAENENELLEVVEQEEKL